MDDLFRLDGTVAVVVGGGGNIGGAMAQGLSSYGAKVAIADIRVNDAKKTANEIQGKGFSQTEAYEVDVTDEESVINLRDHVIARFGTVDILVNSQGVHRSKLASEFPLEDWEFLFRVNTRGIMLTCREFSKVMIGQKHGRIINVSSIRGVRTTPWDGNAGYNASKAAVDMLTRSLACEWAKHNINVNAIAPAHVASSAAISPSIHQPERLRRIIAQTPAGRIGQPRDMVGVCIFLASPASEYLTGQILYVDGGAMTVGI
jgi:NAD(P)-dependent dehydrogenase (short-subunit alcohol dehydrogenase family)